MVSQANTPKSAVTTAKNPADAKSDANRRKAPAVITTFLFLMVAGMVGVSVWAQRHRCPHQCRVPSTALFETEMSPIQLSLLGTNSQENDLYDGADRFAV